MLTDSLTPTICAPAFLLAMRATSPATAIFAPVPLLAMWANGSSFADTAHRLPLLVLAHQMPVLSLLLGYG